MTACCCRWTQPAKTSTRKASGGGSESMAQACPRGRSGSRRGRFAIMRHQRSGRVLERDAFLRLRRLRRLSRDPASAEFSHTTTLWPAALSSPGADDVHQPDVGNVLAPGKVDVALVGYRILFKIASPADEVRQRTRGLAVDRRLPEICAVDENDRMPIWEPLRKSPLHLRDENRIAASERHSPDALLVVGREPSTVV